jgi:hypothetical protein
MPGARPLRRRGPVGDHEAVSEHVWYVAYGSNMDRRRLDLYLHGGTEVFGSTPITGKAPPFESPPPTADRWVAYPGRLYFDAHAGSWGGAVAFVDVTDTHSRFHGRAWRVTRRQLAWIAARENSRDAWEQVMALDLGRSHVVDGWRWYGGIEHLGQIDGEPAITVTRPPGAPPLSERPHPRPIDYLVTMAEALTDHLGPQGAVEALSDPWPYADGVERAADTEQQVASEVDLVRLRSRRGRT